MATKARHFNIRVVSEGNFRATNIPGLILNAWKIGSAYTGEIATKTGRMILMLGTHYVLENLLKSADEFITEYKTMIDEMIKEESKNA